MLDLVNTHEKRARTLMILKNVNYRKRCAAVPHGEDKMYLVNWFHFRSWLSARMLAGGKLNGREKLPMVKSRIGDKEYLNQKATSFPFKMLSIIYLMRGPI